MICVDTTFLVDLWRDQAPSSPARALLAAHAGEAFAVPAHAAGEFLEGGAAVSEERLAESLPAWGAGCLDARRGGSRSR